MRSDNVVQPNTSSARIGNVTPANFFEQDEEFKGLQLNLIAIHVVSEEFGADCFERSILRAPNPDMKMRMARSVMEEYGHHLRFRKLLEELNLDWNKIVSDKKHLSTCELPLLGLQIRDEQDHARGLLPTGARVHHEGLGYRCSGHQR